MLQHHLVQQFRAWLSGLQVLKFGHCTDADLRSNEACSDVAVNVAPSAMLVLHASTRLRNSEGRMREGLTQERTLCGATREMLYGVANKAAHEYVLGATLWIRLMIWPCSVQPEVVRLVCCVQHRLQKGKDSIKE